MRLNYTYSIKYENGKTYKQNPDKEQMGIEVTTDEYRKVVEGVLSGEAITNIQGVSELLARMSDDVLFADRFKNTDGSSRTKGLKKPRNITEIEFYMIDSEIQALKEMNNPLSILENQPEEMKIYRDDGSYVSIKSELGKVYIKSSKSGAGAMSMDIDTFLWKLDLPMGW
ncbi:hypothetical protein SAMN05421493_10257 [Pseudobutyrivibrio sp. 49]|uniref:hypothetical protein n=1 Tax=Pseudobutyrivibrio sp. 49 TaxID=1855344 RepID=UPI00088D4E23|nr:hypothetical protein [Pseudobutyrivibrio sp. 49]SDH58892.1 hypothetical protein SAMN05421493_10257 [Pseudobutyrivibrio sp. 49]